MIKTYLRCNDRGKTNADRLLFAGAGATAGANRLVSLLGLVAPTPEAREAAAARPVSERPLVLVGPYEHHSNLLPWRDSSADVVAVPEDAEQGGADLGALEEALLEAKADGRPLVVGAFSAASNVTGIVARVDDITALLHTHGAHSPSRRVRRASAACPMTCPRRALQERSPCGTTRRRRRMRSSWRCTRRTRGPARASSLEPSRKLPAGDEPAA